MRRIATLAAGLLCTACIANGMPSSVPGIPSAPFADSEPANMQGMLATHNQVRASLGIAPLRWSGQMAAYAQQWAEHLASHNGCEMQHRTRANADLLKVGENLYWASPLRWSDGRIEVQQISPTRIAQDWASEQADYNDASNTCRPGAQCGHYTQMVWRSTTEVGCGMTVCGNQAQLWICNYNPPGNWVGEKPY